MTYVMADIHGHLPRFQAVMKQIKLQQEDHLYILGDVIDRNPKGIAILRQIMKADNMTMLLGNHEYMMLNWLEEPEDEYNQWVWRNNGGYVTQRAYKFCRNDYKQEIREYLTSLPLNIDIEVGGQRFLLVHGSPAEMFQHGHTRYGDKRKFAVWNRLREADPVPEGKTVIFGHTPTAYFTQTVPMSIYHGENRIGIDCGCAFDGGGRLGCLRLDDMKEFYSEYPAYTAGFCGYL